MKSPDQRALRAFKSRQASKPVAVLKTQLQMHAVEGRGSNPPAQRRPRREGLPATKPSARKGKGCDLGGTNICRSLPGLPGLSGGPFQRRFSRSLRPNAGSSHRAAGKPGRCLLRCIFSAAPPSPTFCAPAIRLRLREMHFTALFFTSLETTRRKVNSGRNFCQKKKKN